MAAALTMAFPLTVALPAQAADPPPGQVETRTGTETPALVSGLDEPPRNGDPVAVARDHLRDGRYRIKNVDTELTPLGVVRDGSDETVRFEQRHRGVRVLGAHYLVRMSKDGQAHKVTEAGGRFLTGLSVSTAPRFPERLALDVARSRVARDGGGDGSALAVKSGGLVVVPVGKGLLAWQVVVSGTDPRNRRPVLADVYVNAATGAPLSASSRIRTAAEGPVTASGSTVRGRTVPLNAYRRADGKYELRDRARAMWNGTTGEIVTYDGQERDVSEFGGTLPPDPPVASSDTPAFTGTAAEIGAVDAHWGAGQVYEYYRRLGRDGLDAGLLGEAYCRTAPPRECAIRDLNDGRTAPADYVGATGRIDGAGVHLNSTIFSGALWDVREKLGARADKIALKALSEYMPPLDDFTDGRRAVLAAAARMRLGVKDLLTVARAFDAHGIRAGWERRVPTDHDVLLRAITDAYAQPDAAGDRYVITNSSADLSEPPAVYTGRVRGGRAERLSAPDGQYTFDPATDGRTGVWVTYADTGTAWKIQVWSRQLDRSRPPTLVHEGDQDVLNVAVEGGSSGTPRRAATTCGSGRARPHRST
ncbi:M4 family metallopeptidase [Streptosporangium sp. NPDC003464]